MGLYDETVKVGRRTMVLFFIIDTSGSMRGAKIGQVNTAIEGILPKIKEISKENADIREQVFYALADAKLPILEMTHAEKSLEDIFLELTEDVAPTQPEKHKLFSKRKRPEMSDAAAQQTEASEEEAQPGEEKKETVTTKEAESYASHL